MTPTTTEITLLTRKQLFGILESCYGLVVNGTTDLLHYVWEETSIDESTFKLIDPHHQEWTFVSDESGYTADGELLSLTTNTGITFKVIALFSQNILDSI